MKVNPNLQAVLPAKVAYPDEVIPLAVDVRFLRGNVTHDPVPDGDPHVSEIGLPYGLQFKAGFGGE